MEQKEFSFTTATEDCAKEIRYNKRFAAQWYWSLRNSYESYGGCSSIADQAARAFLYDNFNVALPAYIEEL